MIRSYSYKPTPQFQDVPGSREKLFFGFELEIEAGNCEVGPETLSDKVVRKAPFTYCKSDGSLDEGFEVVSHPMSWKWIKENWNKLESLLSMLDKAGAKSYDTKTCGLHIHVSKKGLGNKVLGAMLKFVFGNPKFILKISRRKKRELDYWACADIDDEQELEEAVKPNGRKDRRLALNTLPRNTAEFRIFKGTLSPDGFLRAFEFCHSLISAIRAKRGEITLNEYTAFVHTPEGKKEYPHLQAFLTRKGIGVPAASEATVADPVREVEAVGAAAMARSARASSRNDLPTAGRLTENVLVNIWRDRQEGMTWAAIEEHYNLRRSNGMTAVHAYHRALALSVIQCAETELRRTRSGAAS